MEQKGLFELFFVLVMLVLLLPVATHKTTVSTPNVLAQADSLALLTEYAVLDALADQAFDDCAITNLPNLVSSYLNELLIEFNKTSGANCRYVTPIIFTCQSGGNCNNNSVDITCDSNLSNTKTTITRRLNIEKKTVSVTSSPGYCKVTAESGAASVIQVDYNLSWP